VNRDGSEFNGIVAAASAQDYEDDIIKKHENTLEYKEQLFEKYLKTVGFNAEPVLLTYADNDELALIIKTVMLDRAEYEFTTTYRDTHYLWNIDDKTIVKRISELFGTMDSLYIADGHHRSASSCLLAKGLEAENKNHIGNESYNYFMSYLIPESNLQIFEFNRMVKDLNGLSKETFLIKLDALFRIENRGLEYYTPSKKHHFSMYLDGEFYALYLRKTLYNFSDALSKLDAQILYTTVLKPILGIKDIRNDSKIVYSQNKSDSLELKNKVDSGDFKVSFGMLPTTIKELKEIVDADLLMPPKTTYIEPKLRSALTIYEF
jgi:uncharacterized protein (DUF1015 family)